MKLLYNIGIYIFSFAAYLISPFNSKASLWVKGRKEMGRKNWGGDKTRMTRLSGCTVPHLVSLNRDVPVIEAIKKERPGVKIVLTFFSPSGYEIRKNFQGADYIWLSSC